jgi:hypothetical protein
MSEAWDSCEAVEMSAIDVRSWRPQVPQSLHKPERMGYDHLAGLGYPNHDARLLRVRSQSEKPTKPGK